jgi:hypothetical protein
MGWNRSIYSPDFVNTALMSDFRAIDREVEAMR